MKVVTLLIFLVPIIVNSQTNENNLVVPGGGIHWTSEVSWDEIKSKAKKYNKYIFVDCYATWCGPCKLMDAKVYPNDTISKLMNTNFLSVKVQVDTSKSDNQQIKQWYPIAKRIVSDYSVTAMPTFLFFSPDGQILHKDLGYKDVNQFAILINSVLDSSMQYYSLIRKFKNGTLEFNRMSQLAKLAMNVEERGIGLKVARAYLDYINHLSEEQIFTKDNLEFAGKFASILTSSDKIFRLCLLNPDKVDSLSRKGFANDVTKIVIIREEVKPIINKPYVKKKQPAWNLLHKNIRQKYGADLADVIVINEKVYYYQLQKEYPLFAKFLVEKVELEKKAGSSSYSNANSLNSNAWNVFLYSNDRTELQTALNWSTRSLQLDSTSLNVGLNMDTRANLLYKLGYVKEAVRQQEEAIRRLTLDFSKQENSPESKGPGPILSSMTKTLYDMKNCEPTHLRNGAIWDKVLIPKK